MKTVRPVIKKQKASTQIARAVLDAIVAEGLKAGDRLPAQAELAKQLKVSVPTLREAIERLELLGIVRAVHGVGTVVSEPSGDILPRALGPLLAAQPHKHAELIELLRLLQAAIVRAVIRQEDQDWSVVTEMSSVRSSRNSDQLIQNLLLFFKALHQGFSNHTILSLCNLVHELVLFRAEENDVLWPRVENLKAAVTGLIDSIKARDEDGAVQHISAYSNLLAWRSEGDGRGVVLGTGSAGGSFDRFGERLIAAVNERAGVTIESIPTGGGIENVDLTGLGRVQLSITQMDVAQNAYNGVGLFRAPRGFIRAVCRLAPLNLWAVVRADTDITQLGELKQARISAGAVGSDTAVVAEKILRQVGLSPHDYRAFQLSLLNAMHALRTGELDGFFYLSQNPFVSLEELNHSVPVCILPIPAEVSEAVLSEHESWQSSQARFRLHTGDQPEIVPTIGIPTLLIAHEAVDTQLVRAVADTVEHRADELLGFERSTADARRALFEGIPVPLHDGVKEHLGTAEERIEGSGHDAAV